MNITSFEGEHVGTTFFVVGLFRVISTVSYTIGRYETFPWVNVC